MASGRMEFHAQTIMQHANFSFVLPNDVEMEEVRNPHHYDRPAKTLLLLHGLTGTDTDWLYGGVAQEMAIQYNLAVFMPTCGNYFYLDRGYPGGNYATFVGEEFPEYVRSVFGFFQNKEDTIIAGLSMGGFGALHTALAYPDTFSACIALSSALHLPEIASADTVATSVMSKEFLREVFGDPAQLLDSDKNPEVQVRRLKESGKAIPKIYLAVGTEDRLHAANLRFRSFLEQENVAFRFEDGPGAHNWTFWNKYIDRGLSWLLG